MKVRFISFGPPPECAVIYTWNYGTISKFSNSRQRKQHLIEFDEGDEEWVDVSDPTVVLVGDYDEEITTSDDKAKKKKKKHCFRYKNNCSKPGARNCGAGEGERRGRAGSCAQAGSGAEY